MLNDNVNDKLNFKEIAVTPQVPAPNFLWSNINAKQDSYAAHALLGKVAVPLSLGLPG